MLQSLSKNVLKTEMISKPASDMSLACVYTGIAFESCPPHLAHSMEHTIGAMYHIPHGEACAVFLAPVLEAVAESKPDRIRLLGEFIGLTFTENADLDEIKTTTANTIRTLCKDLGLRSLSELIIQQFLQKSLKIIIP